VVAAPAGAVVARQAVGANTAGYREALRFAEQHAGGTRAWAIEGSGHYGAGLARFLAERGETVLEISSTPRAERRLRGKDDSLDAVRTARAALASETLALPRNGERREALRLLLIARRSAVDVRREALVQLRSVIVTAPDPLREQLRGLPSTRLLKRCSRLRRSATVTPDELATRLVLRSLARRIAARRAWRRADRRCAADRRLVAPRPVALRGRLRPPRRRGASPRLERPNHAAPAQQGRRPATQPRPAHGRPPPAPARPADEGLHRATARRRQEPPRRHPASQALPRPPPLPATAKPGATYGLTGHR
jgi:transposase